MFSQHQGPAGGKMSVKSHSTDSEGTKIWKSKVFNVTSERGLRGYDVKNTRKTEFLIQR